VLNFYCELQLDDESFNKRQRYEFDNDYTYIVQQGIHYLRPAIYSPLLSFNRAVSQQSHFIFQIHTMNEKQRINPSCIFKIPAYYKEGILESLNRLNINRATIYQDFDNIAAYINEKHTLKV
jgi:predicted patatin/cPLA2 family phospholipase